jgi:hypothetical protein
VVFTVQSSNEELPQLNGSKNSQEEINDGVKAWIRSDMLKSMTAYQHTSLYEANGGLD